MALHSDAAVWTRGVAESVRLVQVGAEVHHAALVFGLLLSLGLLATCLASVAVALRVKLPQGSPAQVETSPRSPRVVASQASRGRRRLSPPATPAGVRSPMAGQLIFSLQQQQPSTESEEGGRSAAPQQEQNIPTAD